MYKHVQTTIFLNDYSVPGPGHCDLCSTIDSISWHGVMACGLPDPRDRVVSANFLMKKQTCGTCNDTVKHLKRISKFKSSESSQKLVPISWLHDATRNFRASRGTAPLCLLYCSVFCAYIRIYINVFTMYAVSNKKHLYQRRANASYNTLLTQIHARFHIPQ